MKFDWPVIISWTIMIGVGYFTLRAIIYMLKVIL